MSAASNCDCACPTPEIVTVPGTAGAAGASGSAGADGVSAFTTLTADLEIPAIGANVIASVASSAMFAIGETLFLGDGTDQGHFSVVSKPSALSVELEFLGYDGDSVATSIIASGSMVVPSGTQPSGPFAIASGGTGSTTATLARAALGIGGANLSVYAAGTAYQLTATPALLNFGTTDPSITITSAGVWLILARARIDYTAATFAAVRTGTLKVRRTNNTAADIANSSSGFLTDIITTLTYTLAVVDLQPIIYTTTNSNDVLEVWGSISVVPTAGSLDASEASIVAVKLFDQTV